jgi:hypothetical protein
MLPGVAYFVDAEWNSSVVKEVHFNCPNAG